MRQLTILLVAVIGFVSCQSTYFFSSLKTTDRYMEKVENGDFLLENDSLWIAYCFKGENAPIRITVFNKMTKPLYVDWAQSALVIKGIAYSYVGEQSEYSEEMYQQSGDSWMSYFSTSKIDRSDGYVSEIPTNRLVSRSALRLNVSFEGLNRKVYKSRTIGNKDGEAKNVKVAEFSEEDSPLVFSSYLTTYTNKENPMVYRQDFYMSNLIKAKGLSPSQLPGELAKRGDMFYVEKPANNSFWEGLLGAGIVVGAVVLEAALDSDE